MKKVYYLFQAATARNLRVEEGQEVTIGRAFDNAVHIDDSSVSRHHAVIKWKNGLMYLSDLGSTNGTMVNSEKVQQDFFYELNLFDEVTIGNVLIKILDEDSVIGKAFDNAKSPAKTVMLDASRRSMKKDDF
ncbi:MAG: FHA domain-containing protein [Bacteroidetes bacterium]|nr:FHA domain-containing protein [Bacteroidota bacterium]